MEAESKEWRALIIDDKPELRRVLAASLNRLGVRSLQADDRQAMASVERSFRQIDVVFLDVTMPVVSGYEVYRQIREYSSRLDVVFCTSIPEQVVRQNVCWCDRSSYLGKPFKFDDLAKVLADIVQPAGDRNQVASGISFVEKAIHRCKQFK